MGEGFSVLQGTKTQSSLYGLQVFVTQQGGKRPGQMASYGWEYSFFVTDIHIASAQFGQRMKYIPDFVERLYQERLFTVIFFFIPCAQCRHRSARR